MFDLSWLARHTPDVPERSTPRLPCPVRPARHHERCLNGHLLALAGSNLSFDPGLWTHRQYCNLCSELRLPRGCWLDIDLAFIHEQPGNGEVRLGLTPRPPATPAGVGQIAFELRGVVLADIDVQLCAVDRCGVIEQVRVDEDCRRLGVGTLLVAAALSRGRGFRWSTTAVEDTARARAFWAALRTDVPLQIGDPAYCGHMVDATGQ